MIAVQNFVMHISCTFIDVPAKQKPVAFQSIRKMGFHMHNLFTCQNQYYTLSVYFEKQINVQAGKEIKTEIKILVFKSNKFPGYNLQSTRAGLSEHQILSQHQWTRQPLLAVWSGEKLVEIVKSESPKLLLSYKYCKIIAK